MTATSRPEDLCVPGSMRFAAEIVCVCGSMRFAAEIEAVCRTAVEGIIVRAPVLSPASG